MLSQSARWSPGNNLVAVAYGGQDVDDGCVVISTASWTSWEFALPDGAPIPEYVFFPEDWGTWLDMDTLLLTVGRGGDDGEVQQPTAAPCARTRTGRCTGSALEQTTEILPESYDFDHDGAPETVEVVTVLDPGDALLSGLVRTAHDSGTDGMALWQPGRACRPTRAGRPCSPWK